MTEKHHAGGKLMTNRDTILRWLFPPADDAAAWCAVKAALFTIAGCAGALLALI